MQSEPVTPSTSALAEKLSPSSESCLADNSDRTSHEWPNGGDFDAGYTSFVPVRNEIVKLLAHF